jgi:hypothetical protein
MATMTGPELDHIDLELDCETGEITVVGDSIPVVTSWLPMVVDLIRRSETVFCTLRGDVIEMRVKPETLWYRLTGELDDFGGEIAVRCHFDGSDWDGVDGHADTK